MNLTWIITKLKKGDDIGYLIIEPSDIKIHYETKQKINKKTKCPSNYIPTNWSKKWKNYFQKKKSRQTGGFLNRYDFVYAGRDTVNQVGKLAPKIITKATADINKIAKERIDQIVRSGGAEIERVAPKIIKGAIEEVYKTPFRLLGNFGKKQKKYSVLKEHKKGSSISAPLGTYTKRPNSNCKNCPHGILTPSSSSLSNSSSTGLISKLPKQKNTKKLHKLL